MPAIDQSAVSVIRKARKSAVFISTNLPAEIDPRDISERALARFKVGMEHARRLRSDEGRANVLIVLFGGWPLHGRLPLSIHHVYAAVKMHKLLDANELDFVASYGVNTVSDLHGTLKWMNENMLEVSDAYVVTSKGHADRLVAESNMHALFECVYHIETHEPRYDEDEDRRWSMRARDIPPHQYIVSGRLSDVTRFGSAATLEWAEKMQKWADAHPDDWQDYIRGIWELMRDLEESNVVVRSQTPGAWRISINC